MEQYAYYCDQVSAAETRSFTYEIPSGGVIRTVGGDDETTSTEDDPTTTMEEEEPETETIEGLRETIQTKNSGILGTSDPRNPSTTSAEPTTDEPTANSSDSEPHVAVIVAAVLGSVLGTTLIAGIAGIAFFFYRRRHRQPPQPMDMAPYTHQQPISTQQSPDSLQGTFGTFTGYSSVPNHSPSPRDSSFSGSVVGLANQSYRTGESMPQISELASTNESPSMKHPSGPSTPSPTIRAPIRRLRQPHQPNHQTTTHQQLNDQLNHNYSLNMCTVIKRWNVCECCGVESFKGESSTTVERCSEWRAGRPCRTETKRRYEDHVCPSCR
ncbi:hypothetical protein ACJZ2D_004462 [Fusarium nematophilum]